MKTDADKELICDLCGKTGARIIHISKSYGKGLDLLVIENVPVISCPNCGESYLSAETMREVENIKSNRNSYAKERPVRVAEFV